MVVTYACKGDRDFCGHEPELYHAQHTALTQCCAGMTRWGQVSPLLNSSVNIVPLTCKLLQEGAVAKPGLNAAVVRGDTLSLWVYIYVLLTWLELLLRVTWFCVWRLKLNSVVLCLVQPFSHLSYLEINFVICFE